MNDWAYKKALQVAWDMGLTEPEYVEDIAVALRAAAKEEREACAQLVEVNEFKRGKVLAIAIRSRSAEKGTT